MRGNTIDPFPFVGHGVGFARKHIECYVGFVDAVAPGARAAIEAGCPAPLACFFGWSERGLCFGSDDALSKRIRDAYPGTPVMGMPGKEQWRALAEAVEAWARTVHERNAIRYVIWPLDQEIGHETDAWHDRSVDAIPSVILPDLHEKTDETSQHYAEIAARLWRVTMRARAKAEQVAALASLPPAARAALEAHDLGWEPEEPAPVDARRDLEHAEVVQVWRTLSPPLDDVEAALLDAQARLFPETKPSSVRWSLIWAIRAAGTADDGLAVCEAMLAAGAKGDWPALHAQFLSRVGRVDEAAGLLPAVLLGLLLAGPGEQENEALLALHDYYAATHDEENAAIVIHGGAPLGSVLKAEARWAGRSVPERAPKSSGSRFAALLDRWLDPVWRPESLSEEERWRCLRKLDKLPKRPLAAKRASLGGE